MYTGKLSLCLVKWGNDFVTYSKEKLTKCSLSPPYVHRFRNRHSALSVSHNMNVDVIPMEMLTRYRWFLCIFYFTSDGVINDVLVNSGNLIEAPIIESVLSGFIHRNALQVRCGALVGGEKGEPLGHVKEI